MNLFYKLTYISHTNNVETILSKSGIFVQGNFVEGFPNALLESCVVGTSIIAFNVPARTKEIVKIGINGYIVEDQSEFIQKINDLLFQEEWNASSDLKKTYVEKFNKGHILEQYEQLFNKLAN